jgi:hypothetical protein
VVTVDDLPKEYEMLSFFEVDEDMDGIIGEIENVLTSEEDAEVGEEEKVQSAGDE